MTKLRALRLLALALILAMVTAGSHAQSLQPIPVHFITANSTNSTLVSGSGQNILKWIIASNPSATTTALAWLKLYDKKTAPTCGTDIPVATIMLPPNSATGAGNTQIGIDDTRFVNGIGFCVTLNAADSDATAVPAGIVLNFGYLGQ